MPKPNYVLPDYLKQELYKLVCIRLGFPIRSKLDCRKLSEQISYIGLTSISESSLYRLFLLPSCSNRPYLHTLDILARFCGFDGWNDFEEKQNKIDAFVQGFGKYSKTSGPVKSLISVCIHNNEIKPLYYYTEQFEEFDDVEIKVRFAEEIFESTLTNSNNREFFKEFSHFQVIREYFFEFLADPSFSIPDYEDGIIYYLKDIKPQETLKDLRDFVFGNCLLLRYSFTKGQMSKVDEIGEKLFHDLALSETQFDQIGVFPTARYLSCKILYYSFKKEIKLLHDFIDWIFDYLKSGMDKLTREEQRIYLFSLGESLLMAFMIDVSFHERLKQLFSHLFDTMPTMLYDQKLDKIIPYFNQNGSIYHLMR